MLGGHDVTVWYERKESIFSWMTDSKSAGWGRKEEGKDVGLGIQGDVDVDSDANEVYEKG